jgi:uroporphyrinogen decarboxylase
MYKNPKKAAEAHLKSIKLYKYDISTIQVEPSWPVAEACGGKVNYPVNKNPWIVKHPLESEEQLESLNIPNFSEIQSCQVMIEGTKILVENTDRPVAAFMTGPLTFSFQLFPYSKMFKYMLNSPELAKKIISKGVKIIKEYLSALKNVGATICVICEHDLQMISPPYIKEYCIDFIPDILSLYDYNILHICGKVNPHLKVFSEHLKELNKVNLISIGPHIDITETLALFKYRIGIAGNIDHYKLLPHGTPKEIETSVHEAISASKGDNRFFVAPGCEITVDTPIENVKSFVNASKTYKF